MITPQGRSDLYFLAKRLRTRFPSLFSHGYSEKLFTVGRKEQWNNALFHYSTFALRNGPLFPIHLSFWKQFYFTMTGIRIKICRQTGPYGRVPQNRFWFVPNGGWSIVPISYYQNQILDKNWETVFLCDVSIPPQFVFGMAETLMIWRYILRLYCRHLNQLSATSNTNYGVLIHWTEMRFSVTLPSYAESDSGNNSYQLKSPFSF